MTDPESWDVTWPTSVRLINAAFSLLCWTLGSWMILLLLLQNVVLPDWTPLARGNLSLAVAIPFGLIITVRGFLNRVYSVVFCPKVIELRRANRVERVPLVEILALVGLGGISLDGGELVAWKKLVILTEFDAHTLSFDKEENESIYRTLRERCPNAWCIPYPGELEAPLMFSGSIVEQQTQHILERLVSYYRTNLHRSLAISLLLVVGSVVAFFGALLYSKFDASVFKGLVWMIVLIVAGLIRLVRIPGEISVLRDIRETQMTWQGRI